MEHRRFVEHRRLARHRRFADAQPLVSLRTPCQLAPKSSLALTGLMLLPASAQVNTYGHLFFFFLFLLFLSFTVAVGEPRMVLQVKYTVSFLHPQFLVCMV